MSSNPRVQIQVSNSTLRVTSSNPRVTSLNPRLTKSISRVTSSDSRVKSSNPRIQESFNQWKLKQTALKFPSFPKILILNRSAILEATRRFTFWW